MREVEAKVLTVAAAGAHYVRIALQAPGIDCAAGQFLQVRCGGSVYSLMPRPISIHRVQGDAVVLLVEVKGEGTRWLASRRPGDAVSFFGPLGTGFPAPPPGTAALVAGGIGVAPLVFLAETLRKENLPFVFLFGARDKGGLALLGDLEELGIPVQVATEDGSAGTKGFVTALLAAEQYTSVYGCGPAPMLKAVAAQAAAANIPAWISLESRMACGVGACRGCVTKIRRDGGFVYENVCNTGPVFPGSEVIFDD